MKKHGSLWEKKIMEFVSLTLSLIALFFSGFQYLDKRRLEKRQARYTLLQHFYSHTTLYNTFQGIDYGKRFLTKDFADSDVERELDQLLLFFDHVVRSWKTGLLDQAGYDSFEYWLNRIRDHSDTMSYLKFHKEILCETTSTRVSPFAALIELFSEEIKLAASVDIMRGREG